MRNKLLAVLCAMLLLPAAALGEVVKDEVVYVKLSNTGTPLQLYVVNCFESDGEAAVTDYGAYTARVNLTNGAPLPQTGDSAALSLTKGRFYYQGDGLQKSLPWTIQIAYTLDGEPVTAEALAGQSGEVGIDLTITPNDDPAAAGVTLQATITLIGEKCLNIRAEGGVAAVSGGNRVVTYAILPGMTASYRVTCQAEDFSMPGIQIAGARMAMDAQMYAEAFTRSMDESMKPMAQNMAKSMIAGMAGGGAVSFADERNAVSSVQFVFMAEGVSLPEAQKAPEEAAPAEGFFDRLMHLFGQ